MPQHATGFAKRSVAKLRASRDDARLVEDAPVRLRSIPLNLAPLLSPYKKRGRLSLRVERLPQLARFSGGRNKGDGSWSLSPDELDDLSYLFPESLREPHTLAIRIIGLEGDSASTLAVVDFLISPSGPGSGNHDDGDNDRAADNLEIHRLRDEIAKLKANLTVRESEVARLHEASEAAAPPPRDTAPDEAALRAAWTSEAAADLAQNRAAWEAQEAARIAAIEQRAKQELAEVHERAHEDMARALREAEQASKAKEARRVATAEEQWREQFAKVVSARDQTHTSRTAKDDSALRALQRQAAVLEATLSERDATLARATADAEQAEARAREDMKIALAQAAEDWGKNEAAHLAVAEKRWRETLAKGLADARSEVESARRLDGKDEIDRLQHKAAELEVMLAERDAALARSREDTEQTRASERADAREALGRAEQSWKAAEAARVMQSDTQWKIKAAAASAAARAESESARDADTGAHHRALETRLAALETELAERDAELARLRTEAGEKLDKMRKDADDALALARVEAGDALAKAEQRWRAQEETRFSTAEASWRERSAKDSAAAASSAERADAAATAMRAEADAALAEAKSRAEIELAGALAKAAEERAKADADIAEARAETAKTRSKAEIDLAELRLKAAADVAETRADAGVELAEARARWDAELNEAHSKAAKIRARADLELAEFRTKASEELAAAHARTNASTADIRAESDAERRHFVAERAALQAGAEERERVLTEARDAAELAYQTLRHESETALARTNTAWKTDIEEKLASAQAQFRKQSASATADATARYQAAEAALAEIRLRASRAREVSESTDVRRLEHERELLQSALASREVELARMRTTAEEAGTVPAFDDKIKLRTNQDWSRVETVDEPRPRRGLLFGGLAFAALAAGAFFLYPRVTGEQNAPSVAVASAGSASRAHAAPATSPTTGTAATVNHDANVRSSASTTASIVVTLRRGASVMIVEQHGSWALIRVDGENGTPPRQGWVYASLLKAQAAP